MDRLIGTAMGPYTVTERIGEGGMAIVYKGFQESLHRYVALKVLRDELARDQQFVARFRQEALAAANLNHPNILHVYDAGAANGKYFISMAYFCLLYTSDAADEYNPVEISGGGG